MKDYKMNLLLQHQFALGLLIVLSIQTVILGNANPEDELSPNQSVRNGRAASGQSIRTCSPNTVGSASVSIPTLFIEESNGFKYLPKEHILAGDLPQCGDGKPPSGSGTTNTLEEFTRIIQQVDVTVQVQHRTTLILETGWLAVGDGENITTYYSPNEYCIKSIESDGSDARVQVKICQPEEHQIKKPILLRKCCPLGMVLGASSSGHVNESHCVGYVDKDWTAHTWHPSFMDETKLKPVAHHVEHNYRYEFPHCPSGKEMKLQVDDGCLEEFHPLTNGRVVYLGADWLWKHVEHEDGLCFDKQQIDGTVKRVLIVCEKEAIEEDWVTDYMIHMVFEWIGAFFYLTITIMYMLTWSKQNLHGRILCCCTGSLFCMQAVWGAGFLLALYGIAGSVHCIIQGMADHFFTTTSFTWLLMINVNLWWTFSFVRADAAGTNGRRFFVYSCISWGFPVAVIGTSLTLDQVYTCRTSQVPIPEYGREDYCFVSPHSQGIYVYYLWGSLLFLSALFAAATLVSLYRVKSRRAGLKSGKRERDRRTILLFLKLLLVMGLGWVIEVLSWAVTSTGDNYTHPIWIAADAYNFLSPILIFWIFGLNSTTLRHLEQVHPMFEGIAEKVTNVKSKLRLNSSVVQPTTESTDPSYGNA